MKIVATDIGVIGGGPAGLSAAIAAAEAGAKVAVIDAGIAAGGQYWMQSSIDSVQASQQAREGQAMIAAATAAGVEFSAQTEVWAVFPDLRIAAQAPEGAVEIAPRAVIVASGAQDRVMPFPGWTLPGVMTPGAGQRLGKLGGVRAGKRVALAGSGPFLLAVASTLTKFAEPPAAWIEARRPSLAIAAHLARNPARWRESLGLLGTAARIPNKRLGFVVVEALGSERIEAIRIAPIGRDGAIDLSRAERIDDIDALMIGWGFRPNVEITQLLRCRHEYDRAQGGWFCATDAEGRTSVTNVFAVGEVTGVAGALPARLSGRLAGRAAARALGFQGRSAEPDALRAQLKTARRFAAGLAELFEPPASLAALARDDTILCRCEEISLATVKSAFRSGTSAVAGAKLWTRAGMGRCQGKVCGWGLAEITAALTGISAKEAGFNPPRIPIRPVPLSVVRDSNRETAADQN